MIHHRGHGHPLFVGFIRAARERKADSIASEAALDGLYIIRTCVPAEQMDAPQCVRSYKALANVERAFRSIKTIDLKVRPIHHRLANRVRAHIFLCMLAYYVEWHMREAWRELTFADTELQDKATRDPVAPAKRSASPLGGQAEPARRTGPAFAQIKPDGASKSCARIQRPLVVHRSRQYCSFLKSSGVVFELLT